MTIKSFEGDLDSAARVIANGLSNQLTDAVRNKLLELTKNNFNAFIEKETRRIVNNFLQHTVDVRQSPVHDAVIVNVIFDTPSE